MQNILAIAIPGLRRPESFQPGSVLHTRESFSHFIWRMKVNRNFLIFALGCIAIEWIIFKLAYPFPDFFSDSYSYIEAAADHMEINIWPIGYSKFLLFFHTITHSDTALVSFQFLAMELAALYFFFTTLYWFRCSRFSTVVLFFFLFCNPLFFFVSNYVSSDGLFCTLTLLWFTELIWIVFSPKTGRVFIQTVCVFLAFTFRYNALYYPFVTGLAYLISGQRPRIKWLGTMAVIPLLLAFGIFTRNAGRDLTGFPLSSIMSGWQIANNALYMRGHVKEDLNQFSSPECKELDSLSTQFFQTTGPGFTQFLNGNPGNFFIQAPWSPLKRYLNIHYKDPYVREWAVVSPTFVQYGSSLIQSHPFAYARYFLLPNVGHFFIPFLEKLSIYNLGQDSIDQPIPSWFDYNSPRINVTSKDLQGNLLKLYPYFFLVINILLLGSIILFALGKRFRYCPMEFNRAITLAASFWLLNFLFSVMAGIIVIRYQLFPMILTLFVFVLIYERLDNEAALK